MILKIIFDDDRIVIKLGNNKLSKVEYTNNKIQDLLFVHYSNLVYILRFNVIGFVLLI